MPVLMVFSALDGEKSSVESSFPEQLKSVRSENFVACPCASVRTLPEKPAPEISSENLRADHLAALSATAVPHRDIFERLSERFRSGKLDNPKLLTIERGEFVSLQYLREKINRDRTVLFVLDSGTAFNNCGNPCKLPGGYPLIDLECFSPESQLVFQGASTRLLQISREDLADILRSDKEFHNRIQKLIDETHPAGPMPEVAREQIRHARGQNIAALITRQAIKAVTGAEGIQRTLNPQSCCVESPFEADCTSRVINPIQQSWALVRSVSTLALYLNREKLIELARQARALALHDNFSEEERTGIALHSFRLIVRKEEKKLLKEQLPRLLALVERSGFAPCERQKLFDRMLEIAWLGDGIRQAERRISLHGWDRALESILARCVKVHGEDLPRILKELDRRIETLFNARVKRGESGILSIAIQHRPAALYLNPPMGFELSKDDPAYQALDDLQKRLQKGELSAVGGAAYAAMRFPDDVLEAVTGGKVPVIFFNGSHEDGLSYVHWKYGPRRVDPAIPDNSLVMNLQGAYGSFARSWVFFRDGTSAVLVSHLGRSRQLSNAGALLLYRNNNNQGVPLDKIVLVDGIQSVADEVQKGLHDVLTQDGEARTGSMILGQPVVLPHALPTQVMILLHPKQLREVYGDNIDIREYRSKSIGNVHVAYVRNEEGAITRIIVPTVGGSGLYGDTAGHFVDAIFSEPLIPKLIPHILFNATAGGFSDTQRNDQFAREKIRGLPSSEPQGFLMPEREIHEDGIVLPMTTLFAEAARTNYDPALRSLLEKELEGLGVHRYDRHFSIAHPGDETYQKIDRLIETNLVSSIDVEAGPIQKAILRARERHPQATFTPIYCFSDDPRCGRKEKFKMLAYGGPLHDNATPDGRLNPVLKSLLAMSLDLYRRQDRAA